MIKITVMFILVVLVLLATTYFFAREVMIERPAICRYCHFITPYYNKWEQSTHNMVPCLKCHEYGPLNALSGQIRFIAGTFNPRPLTVVPDKNCLQDGCHERRLIESTVNFTKWNIVFDHEPHFTEQRRGVLLHCRSCHSDIVQGEHMKVSKNVCFICHLHGEEDREFTEQCTLCHKESQGTVRYRGIQFNHGEPLEKGAVCVDCHTSVVIGSSDVPREKCFFCHINRTEKYNEPEYIHRHHVTVKQIDCFFCHQFVQHDNVRMARNIEKFLQ